MELSSVFNLETEPISGETVLIAVKELRETSENVSRALCELRQLLAEDNTIHYETDEEFLVIFLRPCKYYAKSAYGLMRRIADFRSNYIPKDILPVQLKDIFMNSNVFNGLINRDHKGRRILVSHSGNWDPSKVTSDQLLQMLYLIHLGSVQEPETQVRGVIIIIDCSGLGMKQIRAFTPSFAKKLITFIQSALPLRIKEFHIINNPIIFHILWSIVKPLLREKSRKRIIIHGKDMTSLHKFVEPSHLPEDFGGCLPKISYGGKDWYPVMEEQTDFIKKWNSCGKK